MDDFPVVDFVGIKLSPEDQKIFEQEQHTGQPAKPVEEPDYYEHSAEAPQLTPEELRELHVQQASEASGQPFDATDRMWQRYGYQLFAHSANDETGTATHRYFLRNHYSFEVTHTFGDVMQVKLIQPTPQEMFELPNVDGSSDYYILEKPVANIKFSMSVHWFPHAEYDMTR